MSGIFITGTDTGVGKTLVCGCLAGFLQAHGRRVITQKWVQTGCPETAEDLLLHRRLGELEEIAELQDALNPYCFAFPASPHLAAAREGASIDPQVIANAYRQLESRFDLVLVEGAGGLLVPLTGDTLTIDLVAQLGLTALVVVRNGLGCINHALLTIEALRSRRIPLAGLVFNRPAEDGDEEILQDNPRTIAHLTGAPILGELPYLADPGQAPAAFAPIGETFLQQYETISPIPSV
ncbi:MAG TPA: dethiobiotin synthase [Armatimonadota bacterium]|jgi:dethiobiotin synthetase